MRYHKKIWLLLFLPYSQKAFQVKWKLLLFICRCDTAHHFTRPNVGAAWWSSQVLPVTQSLFPGFSFQRRWRIRPIRRLLTGVTFSLERCRPAVVYSCQLFQVGLLEIILGNYWSVHLRENTRWITDTSSNFFFFFCRHHFLKFL